MPLHYSKDGYTFRADAGSLTIEPGPRPTTLSRGELMQLGIEVRDDYRVPLTGAHESHGVIESVLAALKEALTRCRGPEEIWMARDLKKAIILVGGLDEDAAKDELFDDAVRVVLETKRGSVSLLQRRLTIGYSRASRLIEAMAAAGIVGSYKGSQAREAQITIEEWEAMRAQMQSDAQDGMSV